MHNYTLLDSFITINGNHSFEQDFTYTVNGISYTQIDNVPITANDGASTFGQQRPLTSSVMKGDNIDTYVGNDGSQMIWYINNTQGIENELNLPPYPVNDFTPNSITTYFTGQITGLDTTTQLGNQFQQPQNINEVKLTSSLDAPCMTMPPVIHSNINEYTINTINSGTMIVEKIISA